MRDAAKRRRRGAFAAALGLCALAVACKIEPDTPVIRFSLSADTTDPDHESPIPPKVQDHIRGSLEMLFGTPSHPQFMLLEDWLDEGYDPNYPQYAEDDFGGGEFSDEQLDVVYADNQRAFRRQLELIAEERYDEVEPPSSAPDLVAYWNDLMAAREDMDAEEFAAEARAAFEEWYPTLRDSAELYRVQCIHCHGPEGGGNGPTADFLNPRPRDYRQGIFKFTSMKDRAMPSRKDLFHILARGVTGTAMPSFRRFSDAQLHGLADYVRLLSIRGMVERDLATTFRFDEALPAEYVLEAYADVWSRWGEHSDMVVYYDGEVPHPTEESIERGREIFNDAGKGNCASCHGEAGYGDGYAVFTTDPETGHLKLDKQDDWGNDILPRNIPRGVFRGGRRPIDIYRRIYAGINGTPMPAIGESKDAEGHPLLSQEDLWAVVHYVGWLTEQGPNPGAHRVADAGHGEAGSSEHGEESSHEEEGGH
jgi:mono/diheme cytochrome c family protein